MYRLAFRKSCFSGPVWRCIGAAELEVGVSGTTDGVFQRVTPEMDMRSSDTQGVNVKTRFAATENFRRGPAVYESF